MTVDLQEEPEDESLINKLELSLAHLANDWRREHSLGKLETAEKIIQKYHLVFSELWELGWTGEGLLPDSELPHELMPEYFIGK